MRIFVVVVLSLMLNPAFAQFAPPRPQLKSAADCVDIKNIFKVFSTNHVANKDPKLAAIITTPEAFFNGMNAELVEQYDKNKIIFTAADVSAILEGVTVESSAAVLGEGKCDVYEAAVARMLEIRNTRKAELEKFLAQPDLKSIVEERTKQLDNLDESQLLTMRESIRKRATTAQELAERHLDMLAWNMARIKYSPIKKISPDINEDAYLLARKTLKRMVSVDVQDTVAETMLKAAFSGADPHSDYMADNDFRKMVDMRNPTFAGLGAVIAEGGQGIYVVSLFEGGGAAEGKILKEKDLIVKINGISTEDMDPDTFRSHSVGTANTSLEVEFKRDGKIHKTTVTRRRISSQSKNITTQTYNVDGKKIGYVRLENFAMDNTAIVMREEMKKLEPVDGWVLDLRGNAGGLVDMAVDVSALFLGRRKIVLWEMVAERPDFKSLKTGLFNKASFTQPMSVLVSKMSASASEIVAGALQLNGRAVVVSSSDSSFKKGTIQNVAPIPMFNIPVKGGVKITTGYFYDINGQPIQNRGVNPDIRIPLKEKVDGDEEEFNESKLEHTLPTPSALPIDPQIIAEHEIMRAPLLEQLKEIAPKYGRDFVKSFDMTKEDVALEASKNVVVDLVVLKEKEEAKKKKELEKKAN